MSVCDMSNAEQKLTKAIQELRKMERELERNLKNAEQDEVEGLRAALMVVRKMLNLLED